MSTIRSRFTDLFHDAKSRYWESIFLGLILIYTLMLLDRALEYTSDPRLFPLLIGVPLCALIFVRVTMLLTGRINVSSSGMFDDVTAQLSETETVDPVYGKLTIYRRQIEIIAWLVGFSGLIWALGFQISVVIFVFAFVAVYEGDLWRASIATIITYALVYVLFIQFLSVPLYESALLPDQITTLLPGFVGWST